MVGAGCKIDVVPQALAFGIQKTDRGSDEYMNKEDRIEDYSG